MRLMAGHLAELGLFEVRRGRVMPPDSLLSMIWPDLDKWQDKFGPQDHQIGDLAAMGFTNLLRYLREVILQDSVALRELFPDHPIWNHPVFSHEDYSQFAEAVRQIEQDGQAPSQLEIIQQALPHLVDYLQAMQACMKQEIGDLRTAIDKVPGQLEYMISGGLVFRQPPALGPLLQETLPGVQSGPLLGQLLGQQLAQQPVQQPV